MADRKGELERTAKEFLRSARMLHSAGEKNSAGVLYFKAVFVLLDLRIFLAEKRVPKDHSERFRILERRFPELYGRLDRLFPEYQKSYSTRLEDRTVEEVKSFAEGLSEGD